MVYFIIGSVNDECLDEMRDRDQGNSVCTGSPERGMCRYIIKSMSLISHNGILCRRSYHGSILHAILLIHVGCDNYQFAPEIDGGLRLFGNRCTSDERHQAMKQLAGKKEEHPLEFARLAHSFEKTGKNQLPACFDCDLGGAVSLDRQSR